MFKLCIIFSFKDYIFLSSENPVQVSVITEVSLRLGAGRNSDLAPRRSLGKAFKMFKIYS